MSRRNKLLGRLLEPALKKLHLPALQRIRFGEDEPKRVLMYCASNVGIGPLFRLLRIGHRLRQLVPSVNIMLLTDAGDANVVRNGTETSVVKLPGFKFREGSFKDEPIGLDFSKDQLRHVRANLIQSTAYSFQPHLFIMDSAPHGKRNELAPVLEHLGGLPHPPVRILQMRDIPFPPADQAAVEKYREMLVENPGYYDYFFIAGDDRFFNVAESYGWPEALSRKLLYLGFVTPESEGADSGGKNGEGDRIDAMLALDRKRIVVSFGGGWEAGSLGKRLLEDYLQLAAHRPDELQLFLFTGPGIDDAAFEVLERHVQRRGDVFVTRYSPEFPNVLNRCDLAILQSGSTPFQILETDIPMVLYTRDFKSDEQQDRARRLTQFPNVRVIDKDWLVQGDLLKLIEEMLSVERTQRRTGYDFGGVERGARVLARLLEHSGEAERPRVEELSALGPR